ncbi:MAG: cytochrome b/b6 domain-containing protein [Bryobacteraceae bacterium]|nr:cytochrome b/b6 domain-containing protein [Bryobacteraceae bacterium]
MGTRCWIVSQAALMLLATGGWAQQMKVDSAGCADCHATSKHGGRFPDEVSRSAHAGMECLDCHSDRGVVDPTRDPVHQRKDPAFQVTDTACRQCHVEAAEQYKVHGRFDAGANPDIPQCASCHGDHDIQPSAVGNSHTHPANLPNTCGKCHENIDLTRKYEILFDKAIDNYKSSVHGRATKGGVFVAATCNDCHSTGGSAHQILSAGNAESSVNHFNIPKTCGRCHNGVEHDFWEGIHGKLVARGKTDSPVCTSCHGEHGIISPGDPRSPVSKARVAEQTCARCHESVTLNEKYGIPSGRLRTFIDSYHGLKTKAGDPAVANCASCHGVHRILPSTDPTSTIHSANLRHTCGSCHPGISEELANTPIHDVTGQGLRTAAANVIERFYIIAIWAIIGLMVVHWLFDLGRHLHHVFTAKPQIRRMRTGEVWQHALLMISFIVLVISGFALRFNESWFARFFFGWPGGFELRGVVHRIAAVIFGITVLWHLVFVAVTHRGREFVRDMIPHPRDVRQFWNRILYNIGRRPAPPRFGRFSYVEKAEYWALVWGTAVMILTGIMLWFDNWIVNVLPKGALDIALVVHYWEAWLATLAILVWHMYSTVFAPHVYPMNPSWITGTMPEVMYKHEHPEHAEAARRETEEMLRKEIEKVAPVEKPEGADEAEYPYEDEAAVAAEQDEQVSAREE